VAATLEQSRKSAERPDGELIVENALLRDCLKQIACGFYYRWRWVRGESDEVIRKWLAVRKEYHKELRERLEHSSAHMDSPLLLFLAAERWHRGYTHIERDEQGREVSRRQVAPHTKSGPQKVWASEVWPEWVAVRDTAAPETEAVWLSDFMVQDACRWLEDERGVAWYHYDTLGRAVAKASGAVYAGPGQEGDSKLLGLDGSKPLVASIKAHGTGKNLQMYSKALVLNSPAAGDVWEQLLGRLHRHGQQADEVSYWVYQHTEEVRDALDKACARAEYIQGMHGGAQKLSDAANWRF
jgi:hypothetical protein